MPSTHTFFRQSLPIKAKLSSVQHNHDMHHLSWARRPEGVNNWSWTASCTQSWRNEQYWRRVGKSDYISLSDYLTLSMLKPGMDFLDRTASALASIARYCGNSVGRMSIFDESWAYSRLSTVPIMFAVLRRTKLIPAFHMTSQTWVMEVRNQGLMCIKVWVPVKQLYSRGA